MADLQLPGPIPKELVRYSGVTRPLGVWPARLDQYASQRTRLSRGGSRGEGYKGQSTPLFLKNNLAHA